MGYQIVDCKSRIMIAFGAIIFDIELLENGRFLKGNRTKLTGDPNSEFIQSLKKFDIPDSTRLVFSDFFPEKRFYEIDHLDHFDLRTSKYVTESSKQSIKSRPPSPYFRYSAFTIDLRRKPKTGDFLPGTYATTFSDQREVPSGFAAVGRYALPNPLSARYVHPIITYDPPSHVGTATPNNGQAGGGVEVYFIKGAKNEPSGYYDIGSA